MTLRQLRKQRNYTLDKVSKDLKMPLSSISKYENGYTKLTPALRKIFCKYYNVSDFTVPHIKTDYERLKKQAEVLIKILNYNISLGDISDSKIVILTHSVREISKEEYKVLKSFIEEYDIKEDE